MDITTLLERLQALSSNEEFTTFLRRVQDQDSIMLRCTQQLTSFVNALNALDRDFVIPVPDGHAVRVSLGSDKNQHEWTASLAFPPDCNRDGATPIAEILLFKGQGMAYVDEWGYEDVRRFNGDPNDENLREVARELHRLKALVKGEVDPLMNNLE